MSVASYTVNEGKARDPQSGKAHRSSDSDRRPYADFEGIRSRIWGALGRCRPVDSYHPRSSSSATRGARGVFSITVTDGETRRLHAGGNYQNPEMAARGGHVGTRGLAVGGFADGPADAAASSDADGQRMRKWGEQTAV